MTPDSLTLLNLLLGIIAFGVTMLGLGLVIGLAL